ncbi:MmcQ/YjbR family DNA-binding protein [Aeromicrobium camelliae]|uniref:MmcQ/YjbR family DNA-binding protein n=1 Tax=Aeromicrobium camelliae TaxID=1538144 RepID=UPI001FB792C1|nr:MmcQ/YjbR family DNA-binding protein [Aeromicrobium camelliae]
MATEDDVRRLALALPGVEERTAYGTPAFYAGGRIFLRLRDKPEALVAWCSDLGEREALLASDPDVFFTIDHYAGHASVLVRLERIGVDELAEVIEDAWRARAPQLS